MRSPRPIWMALGALSTLVLAAVLVLTLVARNLGSERVIQTLEGNASAIATALRIQFEHALEIGMPIDGLVGVEPVFREQLEQHREVSFFVLLDAQEKPLAFTVSPSLTQAEQAAARVAWRPGQQAAAGSQHFRVVRTAIHSDPAADAPPGSAPVTRGWLLSGYPEDFIGRQVNAVATDLLVAVLIAVILALEILRYAGRRQAWGRLIQFRLFVGQVRRGWLAGRSPLEGEDALSRQGHSMNRRLSAMRQAAQSALAEAPDGRRGEALRDWIDRRGLLNPSSDGQGRADLSALRMVVFLTALSDELVRPFMAVLASQLDGPLWLTPEALAGIPLSTFLLTWALSQPFGASLLQRFGSRRCLSAATAAIGLTMLGTAFATDWMLLTALRGATGMAFGFVLIFAQTLMLRLGHDSGRASAIGEFVGAVVAAGIIGPVIGGLMAVKLGTTPTLAAAGLFALAGWALVSQLGEIPPPEHHGRPLSWASLGALIRHRRLMTLLFGSAIPGKLSATAVLLLVIPLSVAELGEPATLTGRLLLLYFLAFWLVASGAGRLSDRIGSRKAFVVAGGVVSTLGCAAGYLLGGVWGLVLLSSLLGLGQALLSSPQIVWATQMADQDPHGTDSEVVLGIYRLVERFGGALGPVVVASLVGLLGLRESLVGLGAALALGSVVTAVALSGRGPDVNGEDGWR